MYYKREEKLAIHLDNLKNILRLEKEQIVASAVLCQKMAKICLYSRPSKNRFITGECHRARYH